MENFSQGGAVSNTGNQGTYNNGLIPPNFGSTAAVANAGTVEKTYTKEEVSQIVNNTLREKNDREARLRTEQPNYYQNKYNEMQSQGMSQPELEQKIRAEIEENNRKQYETQRQTEYQQNIQRRADNIISSLDKKISEGTQKYADFSEKVNKTSLLTNYGFAVAKIMENLDNPEDVIYKLSQDPLTFNQINTMAAQDESNGRGTASIEVLKRISSELKQTQGQYQNQNQSNGGQPYPVQNTNQFQRDNTPAENTRHMYPGALQQFSNPNAIDPTQVVDHGDCVSYGTFGTKMPGDMMYGMDGGQPQQPQYQQPSFNQIADQNQNYTRNIQSSPNIQQPVVNKNSHPWESKTTSELALEFRKARAKGFSS